MSPHEWLLVAMALVTAGVAWWNGYQAGYNACDFEHDFDRCPHCGEFLDPEEGE